MPSSSRAQHNFMQAIAHGWKPSGMKHPPSMTVAQDFVKADKRAGKYQKRKPRKTVMQGGG